MTVAGQWYVACLSAELGRRPLARNVGGVPIVVFRDRRGDPAALVDRCPHRNAPLSVGRVTSGGTLQCGYHGWRFDGSGRCVEVPGLCEPAGTTEGSGLRGRDVAAHASAELDGFVWVAAEPGSRPGDDPFRFPLVGEAGHTTIRRSLEVEAGLVAALENTLDVPHTAFLHRGLFRGSLPPVEVDVVVRHGADRVEAEFVGEPVPGGLLGRILAPGGGVVFHVDRFVMPSIAQVEYGLGAHRLVVTTAFTPVTPRLTRLHAAVTFSLRLPPQLVTMVAAPLAGRVFAQDAAILRHQARNIERFGGERFASTEIDVLGRHIVALLGRAERGEPAPPVPAEQRLRMRV